jgi:restriction system protein
MIDQAAIEAATREFILARLTSQGDAVPRFVAQLLEVMGYRSRVVADGSRDGIDIVAHRDEIIAPADSLHLDPPLLKVRVVRTRDAVDVRALSTLCQQVAAGQYGLVVTLGAFTDAARSFASDKRNLRLINGGELAKLVLTHYHKLNGRHREMVPLRQTYIPNPPHAADKGDPA